MGEPIEPRVNIDRETWKDFLPEFAMRNNDRRSRFEVFRPDGEVEEEGQEAFLEDIILHEDGADNHVEVIRIDRGDANADKMTDRINGVRGIDVQYEPDGSEGAIEFTDRYNELITLRLESRIDGDS